MAFNITTNISLPGISFYVYADPANPTSIEEGGTATLVFYADGTYYTLIKKVADAISIAGATIESWTTATPFKIGTLVISNPTDNITITLTPKQIVTPLQYGRPFQIITKAPVDTRLVLTKKQMLETNTGLQPDVYFCICKDDGKLYIWDSTFDMSESTGKFRRYEDLLDLPAVRYDKVQTLSDEQQLQARSNIGAGTITADDSTPTDPTLVNADLLNNQPASYYADKNYVDTKNFVPDDGNLDQVLTKTSDGYAWEDAQGGGIEDAPSDGNKYARKDGEWVISNVNIATASSAGIVKPSSDFDISADGTLSLYKEITISNTAVQPRIVEIGATVNNVIVSWAVNKQPVSQTVNGEAVDTSARSKEFTNLGLISRMVFTVSVADARIEKTGSAAVEFYNSVFYGAAEEWDRSIMTGNVRANNLGSFSVNAGADDYIWYAIPATYKTPRFFVGGFEGGFSLHATQNVTNASGYTESYKIFRSDNKALGQTTVTLE